MTIALAMSRKELADNNPFRGDRLRDARNRKGLTQEDIRRDLGLGSVALSRYELGKSRPLPDILVALAEYLEVSTDWLLGLTDNPNRKVEASDLSRDELEVLEAYRNNDMDRLIEKSIERRRKKRGDDTA